MHASTTKAPPPLSDTTKRMFLRVLLITAALLAHAVRAELLKGQATTTRYWDCTTGAPCNCGYTPNKWRYRRKSLCYTNALFKAPLNNTYGAKFYGTAATSNALGGCNKCFKVTGTSNYPGYEGMNTTLVLKATNFCPPENESCAGDKLHFDIAAPGWDFKLGSLAHMCPENEPGELNGFWACDTSTPNVTFESCNCTLFKNEILRSGCENFRSLWWENPDVVFEELESCPPEIQVACGRWSINKHPPHVAANCLAR